jgi:hypothetical protein
MPLLRHQLARFSARRLYDGHPVELTPRQPPHGAKSGLGALVGLAISFAVPAFAQQTNTPDPQTTQKTLAIAKAYDEGESNNDAAAIAALFTEDGTFVTDRGPVNGRQAIEKWYTDLYKGWHPKNHVTKFDGNAPHFGSNTARYSSCRWRDTELAIYRETPVTMTRNHSVDFPRTIFELPLPSAGRTLRLR